MNTVLRRFRALRRILQRRRDSRDYTGGEFERFRREVYGRLWVDASARLGLQTSSDGPILTVTDGRRRFRIWGDLLVEPESAFAVWIANDKVVTLRYLQQAGIPTPRGRSFRIEERLEAIEFARTLPGPCVVKPACGTLMGCGVSLQLSLPDQIGRAFDRATLYCNEALVEEFIAGENYRFLVYRGRCVSAIERQLPVLKGDGVRTVEELVRAENTGCAQGYEWTPGHGLRLPIRLDVPTLRILKRQGYTARSVPRAGAPVHFADVSNNQNGTNCVEVLDEANPEIIAAANRAAEALGLVLAGVDVISSDVRGREFKIHEVNSQPGLISHYAPLKNQRDPLREILAIEFGIAAMQAAR